ncbi:MAG: hypothetical protein WCD53_27175, partial [Microcoleus sp.]
YHPRSHARQKAGLGDCGFEAIIVCKTRPYHPRSHARQKAGLGDCGFEAIIVCKTRPYHLRSQIGIFAILRTHHRHHQPSHN